MSRLGRVYAIALVLAKSQLRANRSGRSGESIFRNAAILAVIDLVAFVVTAVIGYEVTNAVLGLPSSQGGPLLKAIVQSLVFVPALVPSAVLVAGVLFELSTSSKFASSDSVNWLPVTQGEYVTASTVSVAYTYSVVPSLIMGFTLWPAVKLGYAGTWVEMLLLSSVALIYGAAIVEIIRAAINRVSSVVMGRARRGALVLRLAATVGVILVIEVIFNFVFLIDVVGGFASALNSVTFLPVVWPSLAVRASEDGDVLLNALYSVATLFFAGAMLWLAVKVRSRYWSPVPSQISVTHGVYKPSDGSRFGLPVIGLRGVEAVLVRKDLKGLTRRRELLQYFAIPFVLAIVLVFELFFTPPGAGKGSQAASAGGVAAQLPIWFVGGLFGLIISSISFGQEGRSAALLYSLPLVPKHVLRAKLFLSTLLAMVATISIWIVITAITRPPAVAAAEYFFIAVAIAAEEVCLGTAFGARYPDFQERPRPRFVDPVGIIIMLLLGLVIMFATALPALYVSVVSAVSAQSQPQPLYLVSLAFAAVMTGVFYRWANIQTTKLFVEFRS